MACVFVRSIVLPAVLLFAAAAAASPSLNPDVRQDTIASTICSPGYTSAVRPAVVLTLLFAPASGKETRRRIAPAYMPGPGLVELPPWDMKALLSGHAPVRRVA